MGNIVDVISLTSSFAINVMLSLEIMETMFVISYDVLLKDFCTFFPISSYFWLLQTKPIWFGGLFIFQSVSHYLVQMKQYLTRLSDFEAWFNSLIPELGKSLATACSFQIRVGFGPKSLAVQSVLHVKSVEQFLLILVWKGLTMAYDLFTEKTCWSSCW